MSIATETVPSLYCGTYAKYNNGSIRGKWLNLDDYADASEFLEACHKLHADEDDPEFMFQDFEGFPEAFYNESMGRAELEKLYEWVELAEDDRTMVEEYAEATGQPADYITVSEAADRFYCNLEDYKGDRWLTNEQAMGEYEAEIGSLGDIPANLESFLDYEAIGRDALHYMSVSTNGYVFRD